MDGPTIAKVGAEIKEFGTKAFKAGDIELAVEKYQKALRYLSQWPAPEDDDPKDLWPALQQLRFALHNNSALCYNKLNRAREAAESATKALDISDIAGKDRAKALFRRAQSKVVTKDDEGAVEDLTKAAELVPTDALIIRDLEAAKGRIAARKQKEKAAYKKFFS